MEFLALETFFMFCWILLFYQLFNTGFLLQKMQLTGYSLFKIYYLNFIQFLNTKSRKNASKTIVEFYFSKTKLTFDESVFV